MAKKAAEAAVRKARVLHDVSIDGVVYRGGELILISEAKAAAYRDLGSFDFDPSAVAYCEEELGLKARAHSSPESD